VMVMAAVVYAFLPMLGDTLPTVDLARGRERRGSCGPLALCGPNE
jgi:hypothetical protein